LQVLNNDDLALSEQPGDGNQRVRQAASADSYGYMQPVVNNGAEVRVLPLVSLNSNYVTAAESDIGNHLYLVYSAQGDTPPNPLYTAQDQDNTAPSPLYTAQDDTPPNPLYTAQRNTPHNSPHSAQDHENGSELPTLRANNQTTLGTNLDNLTVPVRQNFLGQVLIQLYCNKTLQWLRDSQSGIDDSNMSNVYSLNFAVSYSKS
jgi:hypothetical protein